MFDFVEPLRLFVRSTTTYTRVSGDVLRAFTITLTATFTLARCSGSAFCSPPTLLRAGGITTTLASPPHPLLRLLPHRGVRATLVSGCPALPICAVPPSANIPLCAFISQTCPFVPPPPFCGWDYLTHGVIPFPISTLLRLFRCTGQVSTGYRPADLHFVISTFRYQTIPSLFIPLHTGLIPYSIFIRCGRFYLPFPTPTFYFTCLQLYIYAGRFVRCFQFPAPFLHLLQNVLFSPFCVSYLLFNTVSSRVFVLLPGLLMVLNITIVVVPHLLFDLYSTHYRCTVFSPAVLRSYRIAFTTLPTVTR